ncbi:hypothetical protein AYX13_06689 [Cryptococcus neoformans]|nr:hypothetical protein AYX13_06689 [Cryptococcus neoformans var. grubii]
MDAKKATIAIIALAAAATAYKVMSTTQEKKNTEGVCPATGQKRAGSTGCPFSSGLPLPDPGHRCDPNSIQEEYNVPEVPPLTEAQKDIIKSTAPILEQHGVTITTHFYKNMIRAHPELRDVFSESAQKLGHQPAALAAAVYAYACNIHDLTPILPVVERIAHKHTSLHITANQYGIVGKHLIQAIVDILGDAVTPEVGDAWYNGYWNLAHVFIKRERQLYDSAIEAGGWEGWRQFKVAKRVKESNEITSFYLKPVEGSGAPLPKFRPGQYTAVQIDIPALGYKQARQYSLSDAPNGEYFRISVKREDGVPVPTLSNPEVPFHPGWMSNVLHKDYQEGSIVNVASPFGDFYYAPSDSSPTAPLVLLSAGVGQTPVMAMLNAQLAKNNEPNSPIKPITYVTVARSPKVRAFKDHVKKLSDVHENVKSRIFYSRPTDDVVEGQDYDFKGRMDLEKIKEDLYLGDKTAEYYICGPSKFMLNTRDKLQSLGVDPSRIHYELFEAGNLSA